MSLDFTVSIRVGLAVLLTPAMLAAQAPKLAVRADTPEAVTRAYIGASKHQQWSMAVALMDPEEVASFGRAIGRLAAMPEADKQLSTAFMLGPQERLSTMEPPELMVRVLRLWAARNPAAVAIAKSADFRIVGRVDDGHGQCYIVIAAVVRAGESGTAGCRSAQPAAHGERLAGTSAGRDDRADGRVSGRLAEAIDLPRTVLVLPVDRPLYDSVTNQRAGGCWSLCLLSASRDAGPPARPNSNETPAPVAAPQAAPAEPAANKHGVSPDAERLAKQLHQFIGEKLTQAKDEAQFDMRVVEARARLAALRAGIKTESDRKVTLLLGLLMAKDNERMRMVLLAKNPSFDYSTVASDIKTLYEAREGCREEISGWLDDSDRSRDELEAGRCLSEAVQAAAMVGL